MLRSTSRLILSGEARSLAGWGLQQGSLLEQVALRAAAATCLGGGGGLGPMPPPRQAATWQLPQQQQRGFRVAAAALQAAGGPGHPGEAQLPAASKVVVYKGRGMRLFRVLVRLKVFQLSGVAALAIPITTFLSQGEVSSMQAVIASALVIGSGVASTALWYYSRRYVGELAVLRDAARRPSAARFSVLDFWGNREDNDVSLAALVPPLQGVTPQTRSVMLDEMVIPVDVEGDRQYFLSLRYGRILDKQQLLDLLEGRLSEEAAQGQREPKRQQGE